MTVLRTGCTSYLLTVCPLQWTYDPTAEFLTLEVINQLVPGAYYIIRITFSGYIRDDGLGLYWDSYVDTDGSTKSVTAADFDLLNFIVTVTKLSQIILRQLHELFPYKENYSILICQQLLV
jgi:hypothetical protein